MRLKAAKYYSQPTKALIGLEHSAVADHQVSCTTQLDAWSSGGKIPITGDPGGELAVEANHLVANLNSLSNFAFSAQNIANYVLSSEKGIRVMPNTEINHKIKLALAPINSANKIKQLERSIMDSVEASARTAQEAATQQDCNRALEQAREALVQLEALKAHLNGRDHDSAREELGGELASCLQVSVFEMSLMVECNLAERLQLAGRAQEALDIYTRLCKLSTSSSPAEFGEGARGSGLQEARSLLCRFGLNIGNVLADGLGEHRRALKHYRLTLDRLSASGPHLRQLRIKLMSNIAISLLALANLPEASQALSLLLADNCAPSEPVKSGQHSKRLQVFNSNHHKFALNLAVCHHERADSSAIMSLLKRFAKLNICAHQHYLLPLPSKLISTAPSNLDHQPTTMESETRPTASPFGERNGTPNGDRPASSSSNNNDGQVSTEDRLESLIGNLVSQTRRSLLMACKLLLDLEDKQRQPSDGRTSASFQFCADLLAANQLYRSLTVDLQTSNISAMLSGGRYEELNQVIRLLANNQLIEGQAGAKTSAIKEAASPGAADSWPLSSLSRWRSSSSRLLQPQPQPGRQPNIQVNQLDPHPTSAVVANHGSLLYQLQRGKLAEARKRAEQALKLDETNAFAWVNLANCHLRLNNLKLAAEYYKRALELQPTCWAARYNLTLVQRKLGRPFDDEPSNVPGETNKQVGRNKSVFILEALQFAHLLANAESVNQPNKALTICQQLIESTKTATTNCAPHEIYLLLSKLIAPIEAQQGAAHRANARESTAESQQVAIMQAARKDFPSNLAVLERLIALHISNFEYGPALKLLNDCIKLRPDQARWYQMTAECYRRSADYKSAIEAYKIAIELFPRDSGCLKSLAKLADELGLVEEQKSCQSKLNKLLIS